ncbi:RidA family protein [Nocardia xishanensis]|uniref:RidA family protein n=1 Tax=Nocardia xishanensis TaxID=238964 RepID=UPI00082E6CC7|nr:RidA family protein [Nocardia xishanensis]
MPITLMNPKELPKIDAYHQVSVATGAKLIHVAGQVSWDAETTTIGAGDLAAQVEQSFLNVAKALAEVGATFADVVKLTVYVVDWTPDKMNKFEDGVARAAGKLGVTPAAPGTLIGVAALASPEHLVEVEATAVLD